MLRRLPEHQRNLTPFVLSTSLRQANVTGLEWGQVDLKRKVAWIHPDQAKARQAIVVPLNDIACEVLHRQMGKRLVNVFTYRGNPIKQVNTKAWCNALVDVGITHFRWHDLRHNREFWLAMEGATLSELQELGGWQSSTMVRRYAHFSADHLAQVSGRLNGILDKAA